MEPQLDMLPYNCTWRILEYLDVMALRETRQASRRFKLFADADRVWQRHAAPFLQKSVTPQTPHARGFRAVFYQNSTTMIHHILLTSAKMRQFLVASINMGFFVL
jgi:hypothetical protein